MPADLFAILREHDEVRRLPLRRDIQQELTDHFTDAAARLRAADLELIPLGNDAFRPDTGQGWIIDPFPLPDHMAMAFENPIGCPTLSTSDARFPMIRAIAAVFAEQRNQYWVAFQAVDRRSIIVPRGLSIILDDEVFRRLDRPGLHVGEDVHAVWRTDALVFDQTFWARRIFDISEHYREATNEDVDRFLDRPEIAVGDHDQFRASADKWIRRRIALIADSGVLELGPRVIREKAAGLGISILLRRTAGRETIVLPADKSEVKLILKCLSEDIFKGALTDTPFESNSKRRWTQ